MTTTNPAVDLADRAFVARPAGPRPLRSSSRAARQRRKWFEIIGLTTPAFVIFSMFVLAPIGFAIYFSLYRFNGLGWPTAEDFRGLYYYFGEYGALRDPLFIDALKNTAFILVGSLAIQGPLALAMALLLNRRFRGRALFRVLVFVPYVLSEVTVGVMFMSLLGNDGVVNTLLRRLGLEGLGSISWFADQSHPQIVIWTILAVLSWKYTGFALLIFLAGLSNVPDELTEAAQIDGASWWQVQRHITLPLLGPTIRIWMFLSMIGSIQVFDVIWVTTGRGARGQGWAASLATFMVDQGFTNQAMGFGNAVAVILFVVSFVAALLSQRFLLRRDLDGALTRRVG